MRCEKAKKKTFFVTFNISFVRCVVVMAKSCITFYYHLGSTNGNGDATVYWSESNNNQARNIYLTNKNKENNTIELDNALPSVEKCTFDRVE